MYTRGGFMLMYGKTNQIRSDQIRSVTQSRPTLCNPMNRAHQASQSITNSQSSLKLTCIKFVMPSSHLILYRPLLLLPPIPPRFRVFSNESTLCLIRSDQISCSVLSDSLRPHESQHARPPCPSPTPGVH